MSQATTIEWTDATWNPVKGCKPVSPGCKNCYAEMIAARFSGSYPDKPENPKATFHGFAIMTDHGPQWTGKVELIESKLLEPLHWRKPRRVFVNSMSDLWHENLPRVQIARTYAVMAYCQWLTFQVLTKRPDVRFQYCGLENDVRDLLQCLLSEHCPPRHAKPFRWPLPNVWEGVSVENQETADSRIPELLRTPAAVRFISYEPALGPLSFRWAKWHKYTNAPGTVSGHLDGMKGIDWVIAGGESGPGARPIDPAWVRNIRDQCQAARVAFFFKQWGGIRKGEAGATLDGKEWKEFPKGSASE